MSKTKSICRRCHRVRSVNQARYCAECNAILRGQEQPRPLVSGAPVVSGQGDSDPPPETPRADPEPEKIPSTEPPPPPAESPPPTPPLPPL